MEGVIAIANSKVGRLENRQSWVRLGQLLKLVKGFGNLPRGEQGLRFEQQDVVDGRARWVAVLKLPGRDIGVVESTAFDQSLNDTEVGLLREFVVRMKREEIAECRGRLLGMTE